ncbi:DUF1289 domain-containing protein [Serratia marcescens]|uniref:DUF1289 domain-containing protein n=1 Tax=Serratia marcescens TaxID=615 RepID=UPI001CFFD485|nr:DUF1289 domain-containing protein [Serratia marcescens]
MTGDNQQFHPGVRSPCVSLCRIDDETQQCRGCRRTRAEIAAWPNRQRRGETRHLAAA